MKKLLRAFCLPTALIVAGHVFAQPACAQDPRNITVTPDLLWSIAHTLKQELQDGAIARADLRAIELRAARYAAGKNVFEHQ